MSASVSRLVLEVIAAYTPKDCCYDPNDRTDPRNSRLTALLVASASLVPGLAPTGLYATLTASASLSSRLREANTFGPQLLEGRAGLLGTLSDCKTLHCNMRLGKAPEFFGRLTVVKDERIFR